MSRRYVILGSGPAGVAAATAPFFPPSGPRLEGVRDVGKTTAKIRHPAMIGGVQTGTRARQRIAPDQFEGMEQ